MHCSLDSEHTLKCQVNIFSTNRDITKYHSFCMTTSKTDNGDAKAIAISRVFS